MVKSPFAWLAALWIGVMIHVDWHLGRPGHGELSFGLSYHWLLAVVTFAPVAWLVARRWPAALPQASSFIVLLGVALGQGLEPLGEVAFTSEGWGPFTSSIRWRVFVEFMVSGAVTYLVSAALAVQRLRSLGAPS